eukprot:TRINITY_DN30726_c0_g1_i1.p1 TRINITY_DN30726_c0_g1~~TRINITY_DN30726_c0_g1_i1.p1  ORF type:complete len:189 (-),score=34.40 TRINITY_DN30726_c0_g1_i1:93-659(-)
MTDLEPPSPAERQPGENNNEPGPRSPADESGSLLDCNICLDNAVDPVVTMCGHLYCWPCIFQWIRHGERPCPVCKSAVTKDRCIPLYGRGQKQRVDPREKEMPQRPAGQRQGPTRSAAGFNPFGGPVHFDNMTFSAGFGFFPSLFGLQFQTFPPHQQQGPAGPLSQDEMLSRALMAMAMFVMFCLLFL